MSPCPLEMWKKCAHTHTHRDAKTPAVSWSVLVCIFPPKLRKQGPDCDFDCRPEELDTLVRCFKRSYDNTSMAYQIAKTRLDSKP